jgi:hypothetical protein
MRHRFGTFSSLILVLALSTTFVTGCGEKAGKRPPLGKVKGKVIYKGNPVPGVNVTFTMVGASRAGTGTTDDNGEFAVSTYDTNDGALVGTHQVTVSQNTAKPNAPPMSPLDLAKSGPPPAPKGGVIPSKYASLSTTPLKNTIEPGENSVTLELRD